MVSPPTGSPATVRIVDALIGANGMPAKEAVSRALDERMRREVLAELSMRMNSADGGARDALAWHSDIVCHIETLTPAQRDRQIQDGRRYAVLSAGESNGPAYKLIELARLLIKTFRGEQDQSSVATADCLEMLLLVATAPPSIRGDRAQTFERMFVDLHPGANSASRAASLVESISDCVEAYSGTHGPEYIATFGESIARAGWPEAGSLCALGATLASIQTPTKAVDMLARARELAAAAPNGFAMIYVQLVVAMRLSPSTLQLALLTQAAAALEILIAQKKAHAPAKWQSLLALTYLAITISGGVKTGMPPQRLITKALKIQNKLLREGDHPALGEVRVHAAMARVLKAALFIPGVAKLLPRFFGVTTISAASQGKIKPEELEAVGARFEHWSNEAVISMGASSRGETPRDSLEQLSELSSINAELSRMLHNSPPDQALDTPSNKFVANVPAIYEVHDEVERLIRSGSEDEALAAAVKGMELRRQAYFTAATMDEARAAAQAGQRLPANAARLRLRTMQPAAVFRKYAVESGLMASDVAGDVAQRLANQFPDRAYEITALRQEIFRSRSKVTTSLGKVTASAKLEALDVLNERWVSIWKASLDQSPEPNVKDYVDSTGGVVVTLATATAGSTAFILTSDGEVSVLDLPRLTSARAEEMTRTFILAELRYAEGIQKQRSMAAADFDEALADTARECWTGFVGELEQRLGELEVSPTAALTFVGMGHLEQLPLQAAWRPCGDKRRHLVEDRVVRFAPSFGALSVMRGRKTARSGAARAVVGFFVPSPQASELDLRGSIDVELPGLLQLYGDQLRVYRGWSGTRAALVSELETIAADERVTDLHFSLHGVFNGVLTELSALKLSPSFLEAGDVTVLDLLGMPPSQAMGSVCLACCRTGKQDLLGQGHESVGLVEAFLALGATSVLSSLYPILDEAAAELIPDVYARRLEGADLAEALTMTVRHRMSRRDIPPLPLINWAALRATCG